MGELKATLPALTSLRFLCGAFRRRFSLQPGPPDISALARRLRLRAGDVFLHSVRLCADLCQRRVCRHRLRDAQRTAALHHRACCTALAGLSCGLALAVPVDAVLVFTMLQAWVPSAALAWNAPAWSLSNEMFFYAFNVQ
jgi:hypothetical protein